MAPSKAKRGRLKSGVGPQPTPFLFRGNPAPVAFSTRWLIQLSACLPAMDCYLPAASPVLQGLAVLKVSRSYPGSATLYRSANTLVPTKANDIQPRSTTALARGVLFTTGCLPGAAVAGSLSAGIRVDSAVAASSDSANRLLKKSLCLETTETKYSLVLRE